MKMEEAKEPLQEGVKFAAQIHHSMKRIYVTSAVVPVTAFTCVLAAVRAPAVHSWLALQSAASSTSRTQHQLKFEQHTLLTSQP